MVRECRLTTIDNPYNPFENFDLWFNYDSINGYNTCGYLARVAFTSDQLTDYENNLVIETAIDSIIQNDFMGLYTKVYRDETPS